jgi:hypothetical protein
VRFFLAVFFVLIGAALTFPASAALWEQRILMDEDEFVSIGQEVFRQPDVQAELTDRVADEAVAIEPRLSPEASQFLAQGIVAQLPESSLGKASLQRAHALLVRLVHDEALTAEEDTIVLDLRPVIEGIVTGLNAELASSERIELSSTAGQIVLVQETDLTLAFRFARFFDATAGYFFMLPLVAFGLALIFTPARLLTLALAGATVAVAAGLRIAVVDGPLASDLVDDALIAPSARNAALAAYDAIAATVISQEYVFLVAGLAVCIGALFLTAALSVSRGTG